MRRTLKSILLFVPVIAFVWMIAPTSVQADPSPESDTSHHDAVESDMHEFMEYYFQPTYKRLKVSMASEPADRLGWKAIKSDSLILAESGNLLVARGPQADEGKWTQHSQEVRKHGGQLYRAAKKKDFASASKAYRLMLQHCNACHKEYENGKHILQP